MCLRSQGASGQCLFGAPQGGMVLTVTALRGSEPLAVFPPCAPTPTTALGPGTHLVP